MSSQFDDLTRSTVLCQAPDLSVEHLCANLARDVASQRTKFWFDMQYKTFNGQMEVFYEHNTHVYDVVWDPLASERAGPTAFSDEMKDKKSLVKYFQNELDAGRLAFGHAGRIEEQYISPDAETALACASKYEGMIRQSCVKLLDGLENPEPDANGDLKQSNFYALSPDTGI